MKQSGIDWIGKIPDDWKTRQIRYLFFLRDERNYKPLSEVNLISVYTDKGVLQHSDIEQTTGNKAQNADGYKHVYKNDLVVNIILCWMGALGISDFDGVTSPAYDVYAPKDLNIIFPKYYHYLFRTTQFNGKCYTEGRGIMQMRWRTYSSEFKSIKVPLPPKATQQRIAEYLDSKCAQIDSIIEESKKSIEEYKAWKQSVIFEAVTGKNLNCKKKDSGIEWIGEIPEGWEVKRLKFASRNRIQKYTSDYGILNYFALENIESQSGRFIETENEYDISQSLICQKNDVVFGKLRPYLAKVYKVNELCCCSGEFAVFYDFEGCPSFFKYYFLSDGFIKIVDSSTYGTKMPRANIDFIKNMLVAIPSLPEQESISKMLDSKCAQIDSLIAEKESLIADLTEYKKSLIFEVVTGKKQV